MADQHKLTYLVLACSKTPIGQSINQSINIKVILLSKGEKGQESLEWFLDDMITPVEMFQLLSAVCIPIW